MFFLLAAAVVMTPETGAPEYLLEYPGIEFNYLPEYLSPLVEGILTEENGAVSGQPNSFGISFGCFYWKTDDPVTNKDLWIREKLSSVLAPDLMEVIHLSAATWAEGSLAAGVTGSQSLGLMSEISFTFSPTEGAMGRGRAYGIFRNGYAVLLIIYGPSATNPQNDLEQVAGFAVLSD